MATANVIPGTGTANLVETPKLTLDAVSGPPLGSIVPATDKPTVLGRSSQSDVLLPDEAVSRRHCSISARQGTWFIEDLGSRHGTYVQSVKLGSGERMPLKSGDMVGVGPWMLRARIGTGASIPGGGGGGGGHRVVTLMDAGSTYAPSSKGAGSGGAGFGSTVMRERVERVQERELAAVNQNRLKLLMEVAAAVAGSGNEDTLAAMIVRAAVAGTGFVRAFLLRDESVGEGETGADTLRVVCEVDPDSKPEAAPPPAAAAPGSNPQFPIPSSSASTPTPAPAAPAPQPSASSEPPQFSRSLITAARKGEVVRLTSDAPMQAQSIMSLGIQTAMCAPISIGASVTGFLYLDSRVGEKGGPKTAGAGGVHSDAAAFCSSLAKMYSLALGNISRLELELRQKELVRDLEAASEAQKLIMPPPKGAIGGVRYAMKNKSGRYVAGDLFDVIDLEDGRVGVLLGDVAGKGVPAAILMATAQTHLHVALREWKDPARAVRAVNKHICEHMASNKFISLWLGVFEPAGAGKGGGKMTFVDAGHGYWLLIGRDGKDIVRNEAAGGIPMGIDPTYEFEAATVQIAPGQRVMVFSDGVAEQPSPEGPQFGVEGAMAALQQGAGSQSEGEDVERVFKAVLHHAKGPNLADDTTVACVSM